MAISSLDNPSDEVVRCRSFAALVNRAVWPAQARVGYHAALRVPTMAYDPDAPAPPAEPQEGSGSVRTASMIGRTIAGNFRITSLIGSGAMGDVYQAQQLSLGKDVALKLLRRELLIDETLRRRFELEAKNASSLNHPNCIQIIDFGREGDLLFIAMEFLNGTDLSRRIEANHPFALEQTVHIFDQVLAALEEAHEHGIVHRDLKPANIMLVSRRGDPDFVKVCDFGIAKSDGAHVSWAEGLTMKGLICGTPEYMSPEQARGERLDGRSDLYAAGVVLYQMLTAEVPFKSTSPVALLSMHLSEPPTPPSVRKAGLDIPAKLEHLVLRALQKDPAARPQTAGEFREALREAVSDVLAYVPAIGTGPRSSGVRLSMRHSNTPPHVAASPASARDLMAAPASKTWPLWVGGAAMVAAAAVVVAPLFPKRQTELPREAPPLTHDEPVTPEPNVPVPPSPPPSMTEALPAEPPEQVPQMPVAKAAGHAVVSAKASAKRKDKTGVPEAVAASAPAAPAGALPSVMLAPPPAAAPSGGEAALAEGLRLLGKGEYAQACQRGEDARRLEPGHAAAYKFLGKCYMRAGDPARANDNYRRYLELAPSAPDAAFIRSIVK